MALVYYFHQIGGPNFETNLWIRFRLFTHFGLCKCVIVFDSNSTDLYNCKMYVMSYNNYIIETITKCILFTLLGNYLPFFSINVISKASDLYIDHFTFLWPVIYI